MINLNKDNPTYGKSYGGYCYYKIVDKIAVIYIRRFRETGTSIEINYDVPRNTYKCTDAKKISKDEFAEVLKETKNLIWRLKA